MLGWPGQLDEPNAMSALDVAWPEKGREEGNGQNGLGAERRGEAREREEREEAFGAGMLVEKEGQAF